MFGHGALGQFALGQFMSVGSAALIGVAATGFAGQITPSEVLSLTGAAATAVAGTLIAPTPAGVPTSAIATGAAGTLTPAPSVTLAGVAGTGVAGLRTPLVSVSFAGVSATGVAGTATGGPGAALAGVFATGAAAAPSPSVLVTPAGAAASAAAGLVNFGQVQPFGVFGTGAPGVLTPSVVPATISGVSAAGAAGTMLAAGQGFPQGASGTGVAGQVAGAPFAVNLVGVAAAGVPGTIPSFPTTVALQPAVAFGLAGTAFDQVMVFLEASSVSATAVAADIIVPRILVGVSATGIPGIVLVQISGMVTQIGCVILGRGYEAFIDGRGTYATITGRDCGCDGMNTHRPEWFQQGDTWQIQGNLHYADGTPFNLNAGCSIAWGLQNSAGQVVFEVTLTAGITVLDPNAGTCLITVTPTQSAGIAVGMYTDQLQATDPTGLVSTQWQGSFEVKPEFFT